MARLYFFSLQSSPPPQKGGSGFNTTVLLTWYKQQEKQKQLLRFNITLLLKVNTNNKNTTQIGVNGSQNLIIKCVNKKTQVTSTDR